MLANTWRDWRSRMTENTSRLSRRTAHRWHLTIPSTTTIALLVVFAVNGTELTKVAEVKIGNWSQGVAWSRDGKTLLAQNMVENSLSVLSFDGKSLKITARSRSTADRRACAPRSAERRLGATPRNRRVAIDAI